MNENKVIRLCFSALQRERLDIILSNYLSNHSRSQIQTWIKSGKVQVNETLIEKPKFLIKPKDFIKLDVEIKTKVNDLPQPIHLSIIYEDDTLLVINKPQGLVTHPGAGIEDQTLMNGILYHCPANKDLPRAGIVHRLDKNTSGIMVIAKSSLAYHKLVNAFKEREVKKIYQAIVYGPFKISRTIDAPIGRHPQIRTKMAVVHKGKSAITHCKIIKKYTHFTHLNVEIETGRTHQIRVHLAHIKHPIIGDHTYARKPNYSDLAPEINQLLTDQDTQLLHAEEITINHPTSRETITFKAPLTEDFSHAIELLTQYDHP